jgi:hypothetical protein
MTKKEKDKATKMYSYEVVMTVHIVADTEEEATKQLDEKGGIVTKRNVTLLNSALLYGEKETE